MPAATENSAETFVGVQVGAQAEAGFFGGEQGSRDRAHLPVELTFVGNRQREWKGMATANRYYTIAK